MSGDDLAGDGQTQSKSLRFRRSEELKDIHFLGNSASRVLHFHHYFIAVLERAEFQFPPFGHRVSRVLTKIEENLLEFLFIAITRGSEAETSSSTSMPH